MGHGPRHGDCVENLQELCSPVQTVELRVRTQLPVQLTKFYEPEPDIAIVLPKSKRVGRRHPKPKDILALIEVADTSLDTDRTTKLAAYAAARTPIYWIVNLLDNQIEVYKQSDGSTYANRTDYGLEATLSLVLPGLTIDVKVADVISI